MIRPSTRRHEQLSDWHYHTVVLRIVVNDHRQIIQGELIDTTTTQSTHFKNWRGLIRALSTWLKQ
jgi:hypothetical protein